MILFSHYGLCPSLYISMQDVSIICMYINPEALISLKSLPHLFLIFISYNDFMASQFALHRTQLFLNSNSFLCIPQCSMEENCLAPEAYRLRHESPNFSMESRRLLRFTTSIQNIGDADFRPFIPKTAWEWHACHMHYHSMEVWYFVTKIVLT